MRKSSETVEKTLLLAAMLGTVVSVYSAGQWFGVWLGSGMAGFALAIVVDLGVLAAILASRTDNAALGAVAGLSFVSWAANAQHAMMIRGDGAIPTLETWTATDYVTLVNALVVTAVAPLAALGLAWLYHRQHQRNQGLQSTPPQTTMTAVPSDEPPRWALDLQHAVTGLGELAQTALTVAQSRPALSERERPVDRNTALAMIRDGVYDHIPNKTQLAMALGVQPSTVSRWPIIRNESGWNVVE